MPDNTQNGYCLDIARAQGDQANPEDGLQGHTCYHPGGELGVDQTFDTDRFADGVLYMPEFDVCVEVPSAATAMCFTLAEDTRIGRRDAIQIKVLSLEACGEGQAAYQSWIVRSSVE